MARFAAFDNIAIVVALVLVLVICAGYECVLEAGEQTESDQSVNIIQTRARPLQASLGGSWTLTSDYPEGRYLQATAYDSASDSVILFGGSFWGVESNDTWVYDVDSNVWSNMTPPTSPGIRSSHAMAYDSQSDRVIMFGGSNYLIEFYSDTWAYDCKNNTWMNMNPPSSPVHLNYHAMAYDSQSDRVILVNGASGAGGTLILQTWAYDYDTNTWTNMNPATMPGSCVDAAYDSQSDRVICFAADVGTWAYDYDSNTWSEMNPISSPSRQYGHVMAYDSQSDRVVMLGGSNCDETWIYDLETDVWTYMNPASHPSGGAFVSYDSQSDLIVAFGGEWTYRSDETWSYDYHSNTWMKKGPLAFPSERMEHAMVYDSQSERVILFSGRLPGATDTFSDETWAYEYETNTWTDLDPSASPSGRADHAMAYDSSSNRVIMFGGWTGLARSDETWAFEFGTNKWTEMSPVIVPSARTGAGMAYDSQSDRVILFGGFIGSDNDETWSYDFETNSWTNMNPATRPPARHNPAITYDSQSDRVLILGGGSAHWDDMWAYDYESNSWTELSPTTRPPYSYGCALSYDDRADRTVMFGGNSPAYPYQYDDTWTYEFDTNSWTKIDPVKRPSGRCQHGMVYDSKWGRTIMFGGGSSTAGFSSDTWEFKMLADRGPILIDGNAEFTEENGITSGAGTSFDPFVIEGWDIRGSHDESCIAILHADVHFVIRNCELNDCEEGYGESGIHLLDCRNGTIERCSCFRNDQGILVRSCLGIVIRDSYCYDNSRGISLSNSEQCLATNNICSDGNNYGIYIEDYSGNNTITDNDCRYNDGTGISLGSAWNNSVVGNRCDHNDHGFELDGAQNNSLSDNSCSFNNEMGMRISYSEKNTLSFNNCSNNGYSGIHLIISGNNTIVWNTLSSNAYYGIWLESYLPYGLSRNNTIMGNTIADNILYGTIISPDSQFNLIWNNTLYHNNGASDSYDVAHVQASDGGTNNWWNSTDGCGNYWSDWTTPDVNGDGIVDWSYNLTGSAGARDYYPLTTTPTEPIPEFSMMPFVVMVLLATIVLVKRREERN